MNITSVFFLCALCLLPVKAYSDSAFGRIFTTPQERRDLDKIREKKTINERKSSIDSTITLKTDSEIDTMTDVSIRLSGVIIRSDGKEQIWVNGQPIQPEQMLEVEVLKKDKTVVLKRSNTPNLSQEAKVNLKVGQKWLPASGQVIDVYSKEDP